MRHIITVTIFLIIIASCTATVAYRMLHHPKQNKERPTVIIGHPKLITIQNSVHTTGTIKATHGIDLTTKDNGIISKIYFHSGDTVNSGDVILELDTSAEKAALNQSKIELALKKSIYLRAIKVYNEHFISAQDFEKTKEEYLYAQASVKRAQSTLNDKLIIAPFSGKLGVFNFQIGDYVNFGQSIVSLTDVTKLYVDLFIPESYIKQVKPGNIVLLNTEYTPTTSIHGTISTLDSVLDKKTHMLRCRTLINNKDKKIVPGSFANATIYFGNEQTNLTVPQTAINYTDTKDYIYTVKNGKAYQQPVELGKQIKQSIVIKNGLKNSDWIIAVGANKVHNGSLVNAKSST